MRWLDTQGQWPEDPAVLPWRRDELDGVLHGTPSLHVRRGPGHTCLTALRSGQVGATDWPINDSKGCGGVMRAAPCGVHPDLEGAWRLGLTAGAVTHSHPTGWAAAGALAAIVWQLLAGGSVRDGVTVALERLSELGAYGQETFGKLETAVALADDAGAYPPNADTLAIVGEGWIAEEALGVAVYCALAGGGDVTRTLRLAVNHNGDSDSTAAICGNLLGARLGAGALPGSWVETLEYPQLIVQVADDLYAHLRDPSAVDEARCAIWYPA